MLGIPEKVIWLIVLEKFIVRLFIGWSDVTYIYDKSKQSQIRHTDMISRKNMVKWKPRHTFNRIRLTKHKLYGPWFLQVVCGLLQLSQLRAEKMWMSKRKHWKSSYCTWLHIGCGSVYSSIGFSSTTVTSVDWSTLKCSKTALFSLILFKAGSSINLLKIFPSTFSSRSFCPLIAQLVQKVDDRGAL